MAVLLLLLVPGCGCSCLVAATPLLSLLITPGYCPAAAAAHECQTADLLLLRPERYPNLYSVGTEAWRRVGQVRPPFWEDVHGVGIEK